jgi:hypothetical protein
MSYIANSGFEDTKEQVGNGQCVTLVKQLTGAPASSLWKQGENVLSLLDTGERIPPGTAIATFINGRYPNYRTGNHAAIFVRSTPNGIVVFDQWTKMKPGLRTIRSGMPSGTSLIRMAESYSVVL